MGIPITVTASMRPSAALFHHVQRTGGALIAPRDVIAQIGPTEMLVSGRVTVSEPDVYFRSPGCPCCAIREDLITSVVRATRRSKPPEHLCVVVDPAADDLLTVISTLLSSFESSQRCSLDSVVLHLDAVELATRIATGGSVVSAELEPAVAIADLITIDRTSQVTNSALASMSTALRAQAAFARVVNGPSDSAGRLDAWHGTPAAIAVESDRNSTPSTVVLRLDDPLDPNAVEEWLDLLLAQHANRLYRMQGTLSIVGNDERTCYFGVRSFAASHSERDHVSRRSTDSVIALCGLGLNADELAASFESTVAS
ncbi:MAG: GTP-binding protein [Ilumatobacter sp.]|nr:GTP-binding protein [Ilumatobacter sp.]